jgi:very-short-patch-repair endonuclease
MLTSKFHKKYNWDEIQSFYDEGNSLRETIEKFGISNAAITKKAKNGLFKTRSKVAGLLLQRRKNPPRKHSQETKDKLSVIRKKFLSENPDKVPYRLNHSSKESYPEKIFREALEQNILDIPWIQEYHFGVYSFDFAFPTLKIDVEIDGATHKLPKVKEIDLRRDKEANDNGWIVVRFDAEKIKYDTSVCVDKIKNLIQDRLSDPNFKPETFSFLGSTKGLIVS